MLFILSSVRFFCSQYIFVRATPHSALALTLVAFCCFLMSSCVPDTPAFSASTTAHSCRPGADGIDPATLPEVRGVATLFYQALQKHDYNLAASYLATNATTSKRKIVTRDVLQRMALHEERSLGTIQKIASAGTCAKTKIVMTITRGPKHYHAHLTCVKEHQQWKILRLDHV